MSDQQWYVQGECNCNRCLEERKTAASSVVLDNLKEALPFVPTWFDPSKGFGGKTVKNGKHLDKQIQALLKKNKLEEKLLVNAGVSKAQWRYCADCGVLHERIPDHLVRVDGKARYLCQSCFDATYYRCVHCGKVESRGMEFRVKGKDYCRKCVSELFESCHWCTQWFERDDLISLERHTSFSPDSVICESCFNERLRRCDECEGLFDRNQLVGVADDRIVCRSCEEAHRPIHSWRYKPTPQYHLKNGEGKHRTDTLMFGIELELELFSSKSKWSNREWVGQQVLELMGRDKVYNKHDGSLRDEGSMGFEIVSHPVSWQEYRDTRKEWDACFTMLKGYECKSFESGRCGMHVHLNKRAFTTHHTYKFVDFIYNPAHRDFIVAISGRGSYNRQFSTFASLEGYEEMKRNAKDKTGRGHHTAVDLSPPHTNELRIFRGSLNPNLFHKNMEFSHALFHFTKCNSREENTVYDFVRYISKRHRRNMYRNLYKYILVDKDIRRQYGLKRIFGGK